MIVCAGGEAGHKISFGKIEFLVYVKGKGIYPCVIRHIMEVLGDENTVFYMVASQDNKKSIRGIEKAGLVECGTIQTVGLLKKYIRQGKTKDED